MDTANVNMSQLNDYTNTTAVPPMSQSVDQPMSQPLSQPLSHADDENNPYTTNVHNKTKLADPMSELLSGSSKFNNLTLKQQYWIKVSVLWTIIAICVIGLYFLPKNTDWLNIVYMIAIGAVGLGALFNFGYLVKKYWF